MKRVLIITYQNINTTGGIENYARILSKVLVERGYEVNVAYIFQSKNFVDNDIDPRIKIIHPQIPCTSSSWKSLFVLKKNARYINDIKVQYDLIINNLLYSFDFEQQLPNEIRVQHNCLKYYTLEVFIKNKILRKVAFWFLTNVLGLKLAFKNSPNCVFFDKLNAKEIINTFKLNLKNHACIQLPYMPIENIKWFTKGSSNEKLVYFGRINQYQKNIKYLLKICKKLDIQVDFYGAGKSKWTKKINGNCSYKGILEKDKIQDTINNYKASIMFSKYEGFPFTLVESISLQTPCIVWDTFTSASEIVTNKTGLLIPKKTSKYEATKMIKEFLKKPNYRDLYSSCLEEAINKYSYEAFEKKWIDFLNLFFV